jgi:hypothetical protein
MHRLEHEAATAAGPGTPEDQGHAGLRPLGAAGAEVVQKEQTPVGAGAAEDKEQKKQHEDTKGERKRFATLQAELAMRGYELRHGTDGALYIVRWGLSREVQGIEGAESFARQVGVKA